jgi:hypothetical protein
VDGRIQVYVLGCNEIGGAVGAPATFTAEYRLSLLAMWLVDGSWLKWLVEAEWYE